MFFHVLFAVNGCSEAFITERTLVRLHAHVSCHVPGKAAIGSECCIANATAECFNSLKKKKKTVFYLSDSHIYREH